MVLKSDKDAAEPRPELTTMADPPNQSAKLDFNEAIVFITSNPPNPRSQEPGSEQTDG